MAAVSGTSSEWSVLRDIYNDLYTDEVDKNPEVPSEYKSIRKELHERRTRPIDEKDPAYSQEVLNRFLEIFKQAPESVKSLLAKSPLFPSNTIFLDSKRYPISMTRPIDYAAFTGSFEAFQLLDPYLSEQDWMQLNPEDGNTLIFTFIDGAKHGQVKKGPKDYCDGHVRCAAYLFQKYPNLRTQANKYGATPVTHANAIIQDLLSLYYKNSPPLVMPYATKDYCNSAMNSCDHTISLIKERFTSKKILEAF